MNPAIRRTLRRLRRSPKQEFDFHGLERKDNPAAVRAVEDPSVEKRRDVAVHRLDVAADTPRRFANGDGACTAQRLEELPSFGREHLPEKLRRGKTDARGFLRSPGLPYPDEVLHRLAGIAHVKGDGFHGSTSQYRVESQR